VRSLRQHRLDTRQRILPVIKPAIVPTRAAVERVVAAQAEQRVVAAVADDAIVVVLALQVVRAAAAEDRFDVGGP
jgi:hypothetical protein